MKKQYIIVEHRSSKQTDELRRQISELKQKLALSEERLRVAELRYGVEVFLNNELIDLCKAHDVPYRAALDASKRRSDF